MSPENTQKLIQIYPEAFTRWRGFECGDGWFEIIKDMLLKLKEVGEKRDYKIEFTQIKEKWGRISVYCEGYLDEMELIIEEAERKSQTTCELCGNPGEFVWPNLYCLMVRCSQCFDEKIS